MSAKLKHAEHNESICDKLLSEKKFHDWVITTAFYSSIHFIDHKIFPMIIGAETYNTLEDYRSYICSTQPKKISRHLARTMAIHQSLSFLKPEYGYLMKQSESARYINYNVLPATAEIASKHLKTIKNFCTK